MSNELQRSCCDPFVEKHGMPRHFVRSLFIDPAQSLSGYIVQVEKLRDELEKMEACVQYRFHSFEQLSYLRNDMFDNRIWRSEIAAAEYCGMTIDEYIQLSNSSL